MPGLCCAAWGQLANVHSQCRDLRDRSCVRRGAGVGPELAEAVLRAYPTPLSLRQAYEAAMRGAPPGRAVLDAQKLLAALQVEVPVSQKLSHPDHTLQRNGATLYGDS